MECEKLSVYLSRDGVSQSSLARDVGVSPAIISRAVMWERQGRQVRVELYKGIPVRVCYNRGWVPIKARREKIAA
jgi:hypothetical protein